MGEEGGEEDEDEDGEEEDPSMLLADADERLRDGHLCEAETLCSRAAVRMGVGCPRRQSASASSASRC